MNPYITSDLQGLDEATVAYLRTEDGQSWDVEVVDDLFNYRNEQYILHTPVGGTGEVDKLFWNEELDGEYTVRMSAIFPICNSEAETVMHILVTCPFASQCWNRRGGVHQSADKDAYGEIAEWRKAQGNSTKALYRDVIHGDGKSSWVMLKKNSVKVTVDATFFFEVSSYGIGLLARDDEGRVIQGRSEAFAGEVRPEYAEAVAIKEALSWIKASEWREVTLESDYLAVIQLIHSKIDL
ncbi:uncharacterized protein LOC141714416 [Apium graveolens]|uniref:uncharacterized protein LOC141714416 n=1 Tax=Apium graveolens TaxID=4045 RepID=UPI003D794C15